MAAKRKRGRPRKHEPRSERVKIRLSPRELREVKSMARSAGLTVAAFARSRIKLKVGEIVSDVEPNKLTPYEKKMNLKMAEITSIGYVFNDLAREANTFGYIEDADALGRALDDLEDWMTQFRKQG